MILTLFYSLVFSFFYTGILMHQYYTVKNIKTSSSFLISMGRDEEIEILKNNISTRDLAPLFDHTNLYPTSTKQDIAKLCDEAREYSFSSVCILPTRVEYAVERLKGSEVAICTVIGFPLGAT